MINLNNNTASIDTEITNFLKTSDIRQIIVDKFQPIIDTTRQSYKIENLYHKTILKDDTFDELPKLSESIDFYYDTVDKTLVFEPQPNTTVFLGTIKLSSASSTSKTGMSRILREAVLDSEMKSVFFDKLVTSVNSKAKNTLTKHFKEVFTEPKDSNIWNDIVEGKRVAKEFDNKTIAKSIPNGNTIRSNEILELALTFLSSDDEEIWEPVTNLTSFTLDCDIELSDKFQETMISRQDEIYKNWFDSYVSGKSSYDDFNKHSINGLKVGEFITDDFIKKYVDESNDSGLTDADNVLQFMATEPISYTQYCCDYLLQKYGYKFYLVDIGLSSFNNDNGLLTRMTLEESYGSQLAHYRLLKGFTESTYVDDKDADDINDYYITYLESLVDSKLITDEEYEMSIKKLSLLMKHRVDMSNATTYSIPYTSRNRYLIK